jgi:hypothetical protein
MEDINRNLRLQVIKPERVKDGLTIVSRVAGYIAWIMWGLALIILSFYDWKRYTLDEFFLYGMFLTLATTVSQLDELRYTRACEKHDVSTPLRLGFKQRVWIGGCVSMLMLIFYLYIKLLK